MAPDWILVGPQGRLCYALAARGEAAMTDNEAWRDALWKIYQDNHAYVRHHEVQRSSVATAIIAIASALLAVAAFDRALTASDAPLLAVVMAIGLFGIFF